MLHENQDFRILFSPSCFQWVADSKRYDRKDGQIPTIAASGRQDCPSSLNGPSFPEDMTGSAAKSFTLMGGHGGPSIRRQALQGKVRIGSDAAVTAEGALPRLWVVSGHLASPSGPNISRPGFHQAISTDGRTTTRSAGSGSAAIVRRAARLVIHAMGSGTRRR
jgi:hypothetical protein